MKKWLALMCAAALLAAGCSLAVAEGNLPKLSVENQTLTVTYHGPGAAENACVYMLLDEEYHVALVEMNVGDTWTPDWTQEGKYKARVYYQGDDGATRSEESDWTWVRFPEPVIPLSWDDFLSTKTELPSSFSLPLEYNEPTPPPIQPVSQTTAYEPPTPAPTQAVYPGTRKCSDFHVGLRIRISDNDTHSSTKGRVAPGTDMAQVATLEIGEVYTVLDCRILESGNVHWFMVNKKGVNCWVASGRCERTN